MNSPSSDYYLPLIPDVSPFEVDFVIPRMGVDIPIGIDPFLMFKSRDPELAQQHKHILDSFNIAISHLKSDNQTEAVQILDFPEVAEIGLGYTKKGKAGAGVGGYLTNMIMETLLDSPALLKRGVRHVEEMQLVSVGIGADRTSDIVANMMKRFLIEYTQKQCALWSIPTQTGVPVSHIFDFEHLRWEDDYVDLPISPINNQPIILVPRRIVRTLPWINYHDYFRMEFATYLRAKRVKQLGASHTKTKKSEIVAISRLEVERIDRYVSAKEENGVNAQPSLEYLDQDIVMPVANKLITTLQKIPPGNQDASNYQRHILEILNFLFNPELIDGKLEVRTIDGTERRDIIFTNDSDQSFWDYLRKEHSSFLLTFEIKNTKHLKPDHFNQIAIYLGDRLGYLGFIVTRHSPEEPQIRKTYSIYNDSGSSKRKIIIVLSDQDLIQMIQMKTKGNNPMRYVQSAYRNFRTSVQ